MTGLLRLGVPALSACARRGRGWRAMCRGEVHTQTRPECGCAWPRVHLGRSVRVPVGPPVHFPGLSPVVALVDGVDHVSVHQAGLLITLPLPFRLAGAGGQQGRKT